MHTPPDPGSAEAETAVGSGDKFRKLTIARE
jgi:hypothetical protein